MPALSVLCPVSTAGSVLVGRPLLCYICSVYVPACSCVNGMSTLSYTCPCPPPHSACTPRPAVYAAELLFCTALLLQLVKLLQKQRRAKARRTDDIVTEREQCNAAIGKIMTISISRLAFDFSTDKQNNLSHAQFSGEGSRDSSEIGLAADRALFVEV